MPRHAPSSILPLLISALLVVAAAACGDDEDSGGNNGAAGNNGQASNNGQTTNNGQATNNGTANNGEGTNNGTANNGQATNNGTAGTNNGATNNGATNNGATNNGTVGTNNGTAGTNNGTTGGDPLTAVCERACAQAVDCSLTTDAQEVCVAGCVANPDLNEVACLTDNAACADARTCVEGLTDDPTPPDGACTDYDANEPNDTQGEATALDGAEVDFVGLCAGDIDWYSLQLDPPNSLIAYLEAIAITDGVVLDDVRISLHDGDGLLVEGEVIGEDQALDHTAESAGVVYIKVENTNAEGDGYIYDLDTLVFDAGE